MVFWVLSPGGRKVAGFFVDVRWIFLPVVILCLQIVWRRCIFGVLRNETVKTMTTEQKNKIDEMDLSTLLFHAQELNIQITNFKGNNGQVLELAQLQNYILYRAQKVAEEIKAIIEKPIVEHG